MNNDPDDYDQYGYDESDDDVQVVEGEEEGYCSACAGSGEGQYEGSRCSTCKGRGE